MKQQYTMHILIANQKNAPIPIRYMGWIKQKLIPAVQMKLLQEGYPYGEYLIQFWNEFWMANAWDIADMERGSAIHRSASVWRKHPLTGHDLITGSITIWVKPEPPIQAGTMFSPNSELVILEVDIREYFEIGVTEQSKTETLHLKSGVYAISPDCSWPDVIFQFGFREQITLDTVSTIDNLFAGFAHEWNQQRGDTHSISYIGQAELKKKFVEIHVDFGRCDPEEILPALFAHIDAADVGIKKVKLT